VTAGVSLVNPCAHDDFVALKVGVDKEHDDTGVAVGVEP
jgi:hypothetical protein